ncbi:hypothetical protein FO519_004399 [Halicephalobus sp. NKZ332]|nr:hypothetical protein FO519_004399 [Halicephalobus sp. NKZ332]
MNKDQVPVYQTPPVTILRHPGALDQVLESQILDRTESSPSGSCSSTSTETTPANLPDFDFSLNEWNWAQAGGAEEGSSSSESMTTSGLCLKVVRQPEEQHRARYLSEGSRGAIKDRSGTSNCTIQLTGFYRPTRVELFAAMGTDRILPHQLYKLIPVSGKSANVTPCRKMVAHDGIECLEVVLRPESSMTAVLDCVGILKICSYDAKNRKRFHGTSGGPHSEVKIAFRAYIPHETENNTFTVLETQTETIRCVQQLGVPEVLKMSLNNSPARGGGDLFIIGRNFDRNTVVVFREYKDDGTLAWNAEAAIDKQFLHQCHIVCTIPTYHNLYKGGNVSVTVKCGQKSSHPYNFIYTPSVTEDDHDWRPPASPQFNQRNDFEFYDFPPATNNFNSNFSADSSVNSQMGQKFIISANQVFDFDQNQKYFQLTSPETKRPKIQIFRQGDFTRGNGTL